MRVLVCGAGQVGYAVAGYLAREGHDVTVVDDNTGRIAAVNDGLDANGIVGHASAPDVLEAAGAAEADLLIAVTDVDEVNMVACQIGHSLFGVPKKVARIRRAAYLAPAWANLFSRAHMPIDLLISPEIAVAQDIAQRLSVPGTMLAQPLADGAATLIGLACGAECPLLHTPLGQIRALFPDLAFRIVALARAGGVGQPAVARDDAQIAPGDVVYVVADTAHLPRVLAAFGRADPPTRRVLIAGGGQTGAALADILTGQEAAGARHDVTLIESDPARAETLGAQMSGVLVMKGSALERRVLAEAGAGNADAILTVTGSDETNILAALLAKQVGATRAIALVSGSSYARLTAPLGIDATVSARATVVTQIMRHVRRGKIRAIHTLLEGFGEIMEVAIGESSPLASRTVGEVALPRGVNISAVIRPTSAAEAQAQRDPTAAPAGPGQPPVLMPEPDLVLRPGDIAVLFVPQGQAGGLEKALMAQASVF